MCRPLHLPVAHSSRLRRCSKSHQPQNPTVGEVSQPHLLHYILRVFGLTYIPVILEPQRGEMCIEFGLTGKKPRAMPNGIDTVDLAGRHSYITLSE